MALLLSRLLVQRRIVCFTVLLLYFVSGGERRSLKQ